MVSNLFGEHTNPVGAMIRVKSVDMQVVGVLAAKGQSGWGQDQDDVVLIPFSTAERKVLGVAAPTRDQPLGHSDDPASQILMRECRRRARFTVPTRHRPVPSAARPN